MNTFTEAVKSGLEGLEAVSTGLCASCGECQSAFGFDDQEAFDEAISTQEALDEGGFSWSRCDCCNSHLGGNRYAAHGIHTEGELKGQICHLDVCGDCLCYIANGDEPENWEG